MGTFCRRWQKVPRNWCKMRRKIPQSAALTAPFRQGGQTPQSRQNRDSSPYQGEPLDITDCHDQSADWSRNDTITRVAAQILAGRCGERAERRRWRMKRGERVAAVKIGGVRRKAAQKFWAPQQGYRPLRNVTRSAYKRGVGTPPPTKVQVFGPTKPVPARKRLCTEIDAETMRKHGADMRYWIRGVGRFRFGLYRARARIPKPWVLAAFFGCFLPLMAESAMSEISVVARGAVGATPQSA